MNSSAYIIISIVALAMIAVVLFVLRARKPERKISKLGALSLFLVLAGIIFGESQLTGYSLIGAGVILAVVDIIKRFGK